MLTVLLAASLAAATAAPSAPAWHDGLDWRGEHVAIRQDAQASISTDGMMGNKLVNIESRGSSAPLVTDGFLLPSIDPLNMDETTRTLSETNKNVQEITANLKHMTYKLDSSAFWQVLSDTAVSKDLKSGVHSFSQTMEAVRNGFLVNSYFKKKEKEREKEKEKREKEKD